jgi:penicillin-binding protein 2
MPHFGCNINTVQSRSSVAPNHLAPRRLRLTAAFATFLLLAFMAGFMAFLQLITHDHVAILLQEKQVRLAAVMPHQYLFYDLNGIVLAEKLCSYRLEITLSQVLNLEKILTHLTQVIGISDVGKSRFYTKMRPKKPFEASAFAQSERCG